MAQNHGPFYDTENARNIRRYVSQNERNGAIRETMMDMLKNSGFFAEATEEDLWDTAAKIDCFVLEFDEMKANLMEDRDQAVEQYFEKLKAQDWNIRLETLREVAFGLEIFSDLYLSTRMEWGDTAGKLYQKHQQTVLGCQPDELEDRIRGKLKGFHVSSAALERMMKALERGNCPLERAATLGRDNHDLKCIAAAELYLKSRGEIEAEEAAYIACTTVEMEDVADAVHRGMIGEKVAIAMAIVLFLAAILVIAYYFPAFLELHQTIGELAIASPTNILKNTLEANAQGMHLKMMMGLGGALYGIKALRNLPDWMTFLPKNRGSQMLTDDAVQDGFCSMIAYQKEEEELQRNTEEILNQPATLRLEEKLNLG